MPDWITTAFEYTAAFFSHNWTKAVLCLPVAWLLARLVTGFMGRKVLVDRLPGQVRQLVRKLLVSIIWILALVQALQLVGIDVAGILGAAGILGVAIGFASQTALSNLISGIFLVTERSIRVGDYIRAGSEEGTVENVNLLSVQLRKTDNSTIRVPCEMLIKSPVTNITGNVHRRCDFDLGVDYGSDLHQVREVVYSVIAAQDKLLDEPAPIVLFSRFGESSLDIHIGAWCKTADYAEARFAFAAALLKALKDANINIPFPTRSVLMAEAGKTPPEPEST